MIAVSAGMASNSNCAGHCDQVTPRFASAFGSPRRANTPRLTIIACDSASRPRSLAVELAMFENSDGPKLPNRNGRSKACAAQ